ncbi:hypothetical protein [Georgenia muralis]
MYDLSTDTMTDLGTFGGLESYAVGVDDGLVVGAAETPDRRLHAFVYDALAPEPVMIRLGDGADFTSLAVDVSAGRVVGEFTTRDLESGTFATRAYVYDLNDPSPAMVEIDTGATSASWASAIDGDLVVGVSDMGGDSSRSFVYDLSSPETNVIELGTLGGPYSHAFDVSGRVVVGYWVTAESSQQAFAYDVDTGVMTDLGVAGYALGVDGSLVVGDLTEGNGFVLDLNDVDSEVLELPGPEGALSDVVAIDGDVIVGSALVPGGEGRSHAVVWSRPAGPAMSGFFLSNTLDGTTEPAFEYGTATDTDVYMGDWDGDGTDTPAYRRGNTFYLRNANSAGEPDRTVAYGRVGDVVYVGDWDGDGTDTFAVRRGNTFYLANTFAGGPADIVTAYGRASDLVLVGDWDADGDDTPSVRRGNTYYLKNDFSGGAADIVTAYGRASDVVFAGDWDGDGDDTLTVRRGNEYFVKNDFTGGNADTTLTLGLPTDTTLIGDFDGNGQDTLGYHRRP